jgi:ribosome-associated translation inhibitor RaiA
MSSNESGATSVLDERLRLDHGFGLADQEWVTKALAGLVPHLNGWHADQIALEISVKERDGNDQRVTLEASIAGLPKLVATSAEADLYQAIAEVRKELIRQIEDQKSRRDPSHHRASVKHPAG